MRLHLSEIHLRRSSLNILSEYTEGLQCRTLKRAHQKPDEKKPPNAAVACSPAARKQKNNSLQPLVVQVLVHVHAHPPPTALHFTSLRLLHGTGHLDCAGHRTTDTTRHDTTRADDMRRLTP